jgi:hypothetical protein
MDFGKVLSRSWNIIWNHKVLWLFGILASCGSRSGGSGGGGGNFSAQTNNPQDFGNLPPELQRMFTDWQRAFESIPQERIVLYALLGAAAVLLLVLVTWLLGLYGKTGLTVGALRAEAGQPITLSTVGRGAWGFFGPVVGLNTVLGLISFAVVLIIVLPMVLIGVATAGIGFLCVLPLICVLVPLFIAYAVYADIANVALVKEGLGVSAALRRGWEVFRNNLGNLVLMALILGVGGWFVSFLIAIPFFIAFIPLALGMINGGDAIGQGLTAFLICTVIALPFLIVLGGIVQSYLQTAWTLTYAELTGPAPAAPKKKALSSRSKSK